MDIERRYCWLRCFRLAINLSILAFIIVCLIFLPRPPKFTVTGATLMQFNLSAIATAAGKDNKLLSYKLSLNITIRNPNKRVGVYIDRVQVIANYRKKRFAMVTLNSTTPFYLVHKKSTVLHSVLKGQQTLSFKENDVQQYEWETSSGVYSIDVKIARRLRFRFGKIKTAHFKPRKIVWHNIKVPIRTSDE